MDEVSNVNKTEMQFSLLQGKVVLPSSFIIDNAYLRNADSAFVGGSLIENIGNRYSDVDVHVVTDTLRTESELDLKKHFRVLSTDRSILSGSEADASVFLIHTVIPNTHIKVDIEYRTLDDANDLANQICNTFKYASQSLVLLTKYMNTRDMAFIHRLFNSVTLTGENALLALKDRIGKYRFQYLMYRWKASDFSVLLDMLGAWEDKDWIRCIDLARENMVTQFHAYSHLCGNTNYHRKWIMTYAKSNYVEAELVNRFEYLLTSSCGNSESEMKSYIAATLDFVDTIFLASSSRLQLDSRFVSGAKASDLIKRYLREEVGEYSEMEVAYRRKAYGVLGNPTKEWFQ